MILKFYYIFILLYLITFVIQILKWRRIASFIAPLAVVSNGVVLTALGHPLSYDDSGDFYLPSLDMEITIAIKR
jgi:hypothetical protein